MDQTTSPSPSPQVDRFSVLFGRLWQRYNQEFKQLLPLAFAASSFQIILGFLPDTIINTVFSLTKQVAPAIVTAVFVLLAIGLVATIWGSLALMVAVARPSEAKDWQAAFRSGGKYFWPSLTTSIMVGLIVLGGMILLIIPGIYWAILFGLSRYLVVKENVQNSGALRRSAELVRGHWWAVFWRQLGFGLVYGLGLGLMTAAINSITGQLPNGPAILTSGALNGLLIAVTLPFPLLAQAVIYDTLAVLKPVEVKKPE